MKNMVSRITTVVGRFSDRPWYLAFIGFLAGLDLFIGVIPTEGVLVSSILMRPKRWIRITLVVVLGSALGALALSLLVDAYGVAFIQWFSSGLMESEGWRDTQSWIESYGWIGLALISLGPLPQQPAVALCALTQMPLSHIVTAVIVGRGIKYGIFGWAATHGSKWIQQWMLEVDPEARQSKVDR